MPVIGTEEKLKIIDEIERLEAKLGRIIWPPSGEAWLDLNLSIGQLKTLFFLLNEGPTSLGKLAAALNVTPPNVTGIVERLVEQGMVSREENPENRRQLILRLTEKSSTLLRNLWETSHGRFNSILNDVDTEDLLALQRGLKAVIKVVAEHKLDNTQV